jgi:hypothetical protein
MIRDMRWPNLQEGKKRARRLAAAIDARDQWFVTTHGTGLSGSRTECTFVRTRKPCSCLGCGNPRHWEKQRERRRTRQERKLLREEDF